MVMSQGTKWLILGGSGQLGQALQEEITLQELDFEVYAPKNFNIVDHRKTSELIHDFRPHYVVNCAAWTDVRNAEYQEEDANQVNGWSVQNIGIAAQECKSTLFHFSTDYVFSGESKNLYTEEELPDPVNAYGRSKALGENLLGDMGIEKYYVLRTAWLYGKHRSNFIKSILSKHLTGQNKIEIINDQFGNPTNARELARRVIEISEKNIPSGIYHAVNTGSTSWFDFAEHAFKALRLDPETLVATQTQISETLKRPKNSALDSRKWTSVGMPFMSSWQEALESAIHEIFEEVKKEIAIGN